MTWILIALLAVWILGVVAIVMNVAPLWIEILSVLAWTAVFVVAGRVLSKKSL